LGLIVKAQTVHILAEKTYDIWGFLILDVARAAVAKRFKEVVDCNLLLRKSSVHPCIENGRIGFVGIVPTGSHR
jgi:hypothetical protein